MFEPQRRGAGFVTKRTTEAGLHHARTIVDDERLYFFVLGHGVRGRNEKKDRVTGALASEDE